MTKEKNKYIQKIVDLALDEDGNEVDVDFDQFSHYLMVGQFDDEDLYNLMIEELLPRLQYRVSEMLLFRSHGVFQKVVHRFGTYSEESCIRLLWVTMLNNNKISDNNTHMHLMITRKAFNRLEKLDALKKNAATLAAILKCRIALNCCDFDWAKCFIQRLPDLNVVPVLDKRYFSSMRNEWMIKCSQFFSKNSTLLMSAITKKHEMLTNYLLENDVNTNITDKGLCTSLMMAAKQNNRKLYEALLLKKADSELMDDRRYTALRYALSFHAVDVLRSIMEQGDSHLNRTDKKDNLLLFWMRNISHERAKHGSVFLFDFCLLQKADICDLERIDKNGYSFGNLLERNALRLPDDDFHYIQGKIKEIALQFPWLYINKPVTKIKKIVEIIQSIIINKGSDLLTCYSNYELLRIYGALRRRFSVFIKSTQFNQEIGEKLMRFLSNPDTYFVIRQICRPPSHNNKENMGLFLKLPTAIFNDIFSRYVNYAYERDDKRLSPSILYENLTNQINTNKKKIPSHWVKRDSKDEKKYFDTLKEGLLLTNDDHQDEEDDIYDEESSIGSNIYS